MKFGVVTDLMTNELTELDGAVRLQGEGWYIEVRPDEGMTALRVRCAGSVQGESDMIVRPNMGNSISVSSSASERERLKSK